MNKKEDADDVKIQIERLKSFFKVDSVDKVFKKFDIKLSTYTNYYNRGKLPNKLIKRLNVEYHLNDEWLLFGRGARITIPPAPRSYSNVEDLVKNPYKSSSCMIICEAIQRRSENQREILVAKILQYINQLNLPLVEEEKDKVVQKKD